MTSPPPAGRATPSSSRKNDTFSSPRSVTLSPYLREDRNSEAYHLQQLAAAEESHNRVREAAIAAYNKYEWDLEQRRIQEDKRRFDEEQHRVKERRRVEEERLKAETALAEEYARLQIAKAKTIPKPPSPKPEEQRPVQAPTKISKSPALTNGSTQSKASLPGGFITSTPATEVNGASPPPAKGSPFAQAKKSSPFGQPSSQNFAQPQTAGEPQTEGGKPSAAAAKPIASMPFGITPQVVATSTPPVPLVNGSTSLSAVTSSKPLGDDRYIQIFKKLKELRRFMAEQAKTNQALKSRMGDMRREVRKSIGQLIDGDSVANKQPRERIVAILKEALSNQVQSTLVGVTDFILEPREPMDGAILNGPELPSLFIYVINIFSKAVISQFINECGANPKAADPIGFVVAKIFSSPEYCWRGKSLVDILVAKYRVVCPVLFGIRGNEKMEQGRQKIGWRKDGGVWMSEQQHGDRMTGLGAGYAAIYLRNFTKSKNTNPCPPRDYWTAMAHIVNTAPEEMSNTQCLVLKAMIEHHETQFIQFYGNAAIAALRVALIDFPGRAPEKTAAVSALQVHAHLLAKNSGLRLDTQ